MKQNHFINLKGPLPLCLNHHIRYIAHVNYSWSHDRENTQAICSFMKLAKTKSVIKKTNSVALSPRANYTD
jgi:hypothetical protein